MGNMRDIDALLIEAASEGNLGAVQFLVEKGAYVYAKSEDYTTALMAAAEGGHLDIVKFLIEEWAVETNDGDKSGKTALGFATEGGLFRHCPVSDRERCRRIRAV